MNNGDVTRHMDVETPNPDFRCIICDASVIASTDPEAAIAIACKVALLQVAPSTLHDLAMCRPPMCDAHRRAWPTLLLRGIKGLNTVADEA